MAVAKRVLVTIRISMFSRFCIFRSVYLDGKICKSERFFEKLQAAISITNKNKQLLWGSTFRIFLLSARIAFAPTSSDMLRF